MNVSFNGKVLLGGSTKRLSLFNEIKQLKQYAADNNCDILVCNRDISPDYPGRYHTIIVKEGPCMGQNFVFSKVFDFNSKNFKDGKSVKLDIPDA
jgi:hypothetical protein